MVAEPLDPTRLANTCPDASTFEREMLEALQSTVGFEAAFFAVLGERPTTVAIDRVKLERAFAGRAYEAELGPAKRAAMARHGVVVDTR